MPFGSDCEYANMEDCVSRNSDRDDPEAYCAELMRSTESGCAGNRYSSRSVTRYLVQCRSELDGNTLVGHAAVFGEIAKVPGGYERMARTAFDEVLDRSDNDTVAAVNHDMSRVLGRQSSGTLRLKVDGEGLAYEVDLPETSYAEDLKALVRRGDITGASIGFLPGEEKFLRAPDGQPIIEHTSISYLRDVSPVTKPAYHETDVALRHYEFPRFSNRDRLIRARHRVHMTLKGGLK